MNADEIRRDCLAALDVYTGATIIPQPYRPSTAPIRAWYMNKERP